MFARGKDEPDDGWTSEVSSSFALAGFLGLMFLALTLLAVGPLAKFDAYFNLAPPPPSWRPWLHLVDRVGQRAVCVPILAVVAYLLCRRTESWRPGVVAAGAVFVLNLVVLVLKIGLGRGAPLSADPSFFAGGMAFPSGHSANIVLVYGMIAYLLLTYGQVGRRARVLLWLMVPALAVIMVLTSMTLNWHWFSDLVAGLLVGGMVLQLAAAVDLVVPDTGYAHGFRAGTRELVDFLRRRSTGGPADPA